MKNIQTLYSKKIKKIKKIQGKDIFILIYRKIFLGFLTKSNFKSFMETGIFANQETLPEIIDEEVFKSYVLLPEEYKYKTSNVKFIFF